MNNSITKNKKGGILSGTIFGVGGLIIGVIIIFVIVLTLFNANLFDDVRRTIARNNQTIALNDTFKNFGYPSYAGAVCTIGTVTNATGGEIILSGNYTVTDCTIKSKTPTYNITNINVSSSTAYDSQEEITAGDLRSNFTEGVDNVSEKIPTILLIVAVVFLFAVLILLVRNAKQMGVGDSSSL